MSTPLHPSAKRYPPDEDEDLLTPGQSARSRYKRPKRESSLTRAVGQQRLILKTKMEQTPDGSSPAPPGSSHPVLNRFVTNSSLTQQNTARRPRPLTQHQLAVEQNRRQRIEYILAKRKNEAYRMLRAKRETEIPFARYGRLLEPLPDGYDTEDDESSWGKGGILPNPEEEEDFGECASYYLSVLRKASRRLDRWDYEDANGPKKDRKKEREERQKARQSTLALEHSLDLGGRAPTSARSRARAARNARRKLAEAAGATTTTAAAASGSTSTPRPKSSRSRPSRAAGAPTSAAGDAGKEGLDAQPLPDHEASSMPADGEDGLDDIDRELLGEGSGDEDDGPVVRDDRAAPVGERGDADSFLGEGGDEDADALSSDDDGEDDDLDEGDADENSSTFEGGHGSPGSDASSVAGEGTGPATDLHDSADRRRAADGQDHETMDDRD